MPSVGSVVYLVLSALGAVNTAVAWGPPSRRRTLPGTLAFATGMLTSEFPVQAQSGRPHGGQLPDGQPNGGQHGSLPKQVSQ